MTTCNVPGCNAPRYKSYSKCEAHCKDYWKQSSAKRASIPVGVATEIATRQTVDEAVATEIAASIALFRQAASAVFQQPRRRYPVGCWRPRTRLRKFRLTIVAPDFKRGTIVHLAGLVKCESPMPNTHGELQRQLVDLHRAGHLIAQ